MKLDHIRESENVEDRRGKEKLSMVGGALVESLPTRKVDPSVAVSQTGGYNRTKGNYRSEFDPDNKFNGNFDFHHDPTKFSKYK